MILSPLQSEHLKRELTFSTARSSGPGGQNVNKVNTKVELRFHVQNSAVLTEEQKHILLSKLSNKLSTDGELIIVSQSTRSQLKNKQEAIVKFIDLIYKTLKPRKKRVPTKPTKASKEKRLENKKRNSEIKQGRRKLY